MLSTASTAVTPFAQLRALGWVELGAVAFLLLALTDSRWIPPHITRVIWDGMLMGFAICCVVFCSNPEARSRLRQNPFLWVLLGLTWLSGIHQAPEWLSAMVVGSSMPIQPPSNA